VDALAESVLRAAAREPFVLVGYSTGGALACSLAEKLERDGVDLAGLVLLDWYPLESEQLKQTLSLAMGRVLDRDHEYTSIDDGNLIAMGAYMRLFSDWAPTSIEAPSLLLRASEPRRNGAGPSLPHQADTVVEIRGTHFSILEQDARTAAAATEAWLAETIQPRLAGTQPGTLELS
jgi:polyketide synthase 7